MDAEFIHELFSEFGEVHIRRMFGGAGLFDGSLMFGLVLDGQIYLKADQETVPAFEAEGCGPFGYDTKHGRRVLTSYWRLPERLYDEPDELAKWAKLALGVAHAKAAAKAAPRRPVIKVKAAKPAKKRAEKSVRAPAKKAAKKAAKKMAKKTVKKTLKKKARTKSRL